MVNFNLMGRIQFIYLLYSLDPVAAFNVMSDYLIRESLAYWISRGLSAGAVSCTDRFFAPVKDVFFVPYYLSQARSLDEATGRMGGVATDVLTGVSVFCGTDQCLANRVPGAAGAGELIRKRVATMSVFEKIAELCMQQSIAVPGMNILYFLSFQANIVITTVGIGIKVLLKPVLWRRKKRLRRLQACNAIKKVFGEDVIDVDFVKIK